MFAINSTLHSETPRAKGLSQCRVTVTQSKCLGACFPQAMCRACHHANAPTRLRNDVRQEPRMKLSRRRAPRLSGTEGAP